MTDSVESCFVTKYSIDFLKILLHHKINNIFLSLYRLIQNLTKKNNKKSLLSYWIRKKSFKKMFQLHHRGCARSFHMSSKFVRREIWTLKAPGQIGRVAIDRDIRTFTYLLLLRSKATNSRYKLIRSCANDLSVLKLCELFESTAGGPERYFKI